MPLPYPGMGKPIPPDLAAQLKLERDRVQPRRFSPEMAAKLYQLLRADDAAAPVPQPYYQPPTLLENYMGDDQFDLLDNAEPPDGTPPRRPASGYRKPFVTTPKTDPNAPLIY